MHTRKINRKEEEGKPALSFFLNCLVVFYGAKKGFLAAAFFFFSFHILLILGIVDWAILGWKKERERERERMWRILG